MDKKELLLEAFNNEFFQNDLKTNRYKIEDIINEFLLHIKHKYVINSFIVLALKEHNKYMSMNEFIDFVSILFDKLDISYENWQSGGKYSKFSSESGYAIIANELFMNC